MTDMMVGPVIKRRYGCCARLACGSQRPTAGQEPRYDQVEANGTKKRLFNCLNTHNLGAYVGGAVIDKGSGLCGGEREDSLAPTFAPLPIWIQCHGGKR